MLCCIFEEEKNKMRRIIYLLAAVFILSCGQDKRELLGNTEFQRAKNAEFKDASTSPLKTKDRKGFSTLDFFDFDSTYVVTAQLKRTPDTKFFKMKTTTSRVSNERIYGVLSFAFRGENHELNVYQGEEMLQKKGFKDYLFLPFLDDSNGETTYAGGRYIDLRIPQGETLLIDFNTAYNPYCAYNVKYSCPIVPRVNYLPVAIEAGVKAFLKE